MGILSKAWKGLKKVVKKVGKGIKKVVNKIGKAFGKLGIVGQLGMMFLMPYAMSGLSSFFGQFAGTQAGTWANTLLNSKNIASRALGTTMDLIHKAGTGVGNIYKSVTETIGNAFDNTKKFFGIETDSEVLDTVNSKVQKGVADEKIKLDAKAIVDKGLGLDVETPLSELTGVTDVSGMKDFNLADSLLGSKKKEQSFFEKINIFDPESQIRKDITSFDVYDYGKETVKASATEATIGGIKAAGTQQIAKALGYEAPEAGDYVSINIPSLMAMTSKDPSVFDTVDLTLSKGGNSFMGTALANQSYINDLLSDGTSAYESYMKNFQRQMYQPLGVNR